MLVDDQPISRPNEDIFQRADFALTLAEAISRTPAAKEGFVFAITGEWGEGKSSVLRLIERYLLHIDLVQLSNERLWWQSAPTPKTVEQIEEMALYYERALPKIEELAAQNKYLLNADITYQRSALRDVLPSDQTSEEALFYWHLKSKAADSPHVIVVKFSPWLIAGRAEMASALLSELARALNEYLGPEVRKAFKEILQRLSEFAPLAGAGLDMVQHGLGAIPRATGTLSKAIADRMTTGPTLEELRSKLKEILYRISDRRVLVILDDVDRLTPAEATETISLVKNLGDLPNVIYLFSYHRGTVCKLIHSCLQIDGSAYLEKIVQREIALPPVEDDDLIKAVNENLKTIFEGISLDNKRLGAAWYNVLSNYIRTPRDARRYFNSLVLAQAGLHNVTDPIDLMVLQAIQVFDPNIYHFVREYIDELTGAA